MAKSKPKSEQMRLFHQFKKNAVGPWSRDAMNLVERIDRAREGGTLEQISGSPLLAESRLTLREVGDFLDIQAGLPGKAGSKPTMFPDLMAVWESKPLTAEMSNDAVFQFDICEDDVESAPLAGLAGLFPGCLLIDTKEIGWGAGYPDEEIAGVFVYPTYDEAEECPALRYVGLVGRNAKDTLISTLVLKGSTIGEARRQTKSKFQRRLLDWMTEDPDRKYEGLWDMVGVFEHEQETLNELVDRILGLYLGGMYVAVEESERNGVRHIIFQSKYEIEDRARERAAAAALLDREAAISMLRNIAALGTAESRDAEREEKAAAQAPDAPAEPDAEAESPGDAAAMPPKEAASLQDALRQASAERERLQKQADADKAALRHHIRSLEAKCRSLEAQNAALSARASLIDRLAIPKAPIDALRLAEEAYPDRLLFLEGALDSAQAFEGNCREVWEVLQSMAVVLHPLVFGDGGGDIVKAYESQSGYELTLRDVKQTNKNPEFAKARQVYYKGEWKDATPHVKGKSKKPGETLRVHFLADYEERKLVIAHCGEHMVTIKTSNL